MTKKFLAVTLVLVLAAGVGALAQDDKPLTGSWENELTIVPVGVAFSEFSSTLTVNYTSGGIEYQSVSVFDEDGFNDQEFSVSGSLGLLTLSSTVDFDPQDVNVFVGPDNDTTPWEEPARGVLLPGSEHGWTGVEGNTVPGQSPMFDYWESSGSLTLGGVSINLMTLLQRWDWNDEDWGVAAGANSDAPGSTLGDPTTNDPVYRLFDVPNNTGVFGTDINNDHFWQGPAPVPFATDTIQTPPAELTGNFGYGFELGVSGETPGGVSVDVTSQFGIMPKSDAEANIQAEVDDNVETGMATHAGAAWAGVTAQDAMEWLAGTSNEAMPPTNAAPTVGNQDIPVWVLNQFFGGTDFNGDGVLNYQDFRCPAFINAPNGHGTIYNPNSDASAIIRAGIRDYVSDMATIADVPTESGYVNYLDYRVLLKQLDWDNTGTYLGPNAPVVGHNEPVLEDMWVDGRYGLSAFPYYGTTITLTGQSLGCCDYTSETLFTEQNGFEYTEFEFTMTSDNMPLTLDADLKFTPDTKSIHVTPALDIGWACNMEVYTDLSGLLANNTQQGSTISGLEVMGFGLEGVELGHVTISSYTALGSYDLADLAGSSGFTYAAYYDEVIRIEKADSLSLTADAYFDMTDSSALFDLGLFDLQTSFALSDQFTVGTGVKIYPASGLDELTFSFDYSW